MKKLAREDLLSLERYAAERPAFRERVIHHKRTRRLPIGPNATLHFEDRLTMQYQVQEILRTERIFEAGEIEAELEAYNPLIPDGANWKATFMIEFDDEDERRAALGRLVGIEDRVWARAGDSKPVWAVADEDLERTTDEKTSSVHFLRFELAPGARRGGASAALPSPSASTIPSTRTPPTPPPRRYGLRWPRTSTPPDRRGSGLSGRPRIPPTAPSAR